jgi:hypothetical protein
VGVENNRISCADWVTGARASAGILGGYGLDHVKTYIF